VISGTGNYFARQAQRLVLALRHAYRAKMFRHPQTSRLKTGSRTFADTHLRSERQQFMHRIVRR